MVNPPTLSELLTRHPLQVRTWAVDCAERALQDAQRVLPVWPDTWMGHRTTNGPATVLKHCGAILTGLRCWAGGPARPVAGGWEVAWNGRPLGYIEQYGHLSETDSPFHRLARALYIAWQAHTTPDPPLNRLVIETAGAAGRARYVERLASLGRVNLRTGPTMREAKRTGLLDQFEREAEEASQERAAWCLDRLQQYLVGQVEALPMPPQPAIPIKKPSTRGHKKKPAPVPETPAQDAPALGKVLPFVRRVG